MDAGVMLSGLRTGAVNDTQVTEGMAAYLTSAREKYAGKLLPGRSAGQQPASSGTGPKPRPPRKVHLHSTPLDYSFCALTCLQHLSKALARGGAGPVLAAQQAEREKQERIKERRVQVSIHQSASSADDEDAEGGEENSEAEASETNPAEEPHIASAAGHTADTVFESAATAVVRSVHIKRQPLPPLQVAPPTMLGTATPLCRCHHRHRHRPTLGPPHPVISPGGGCECR